MALPLELRQTLIRILPCSLFEQNYVLMWNYLDSMCDNVHELIEDFCNPYLQSKLEVLQKIAAWLGLGGYTEPCYLPFGLALSNAVNAGQVEVFREACRHWGKGHALTLQLLLRQLSSCTNEQAQADNFEMLAILLADYQGGTFMTAPDGETLQGEEDLDVSLLVDDIQLGLVTLTPKLVRMVLMGEKLSDIENFHCGLQALGFFSGAGVALNLGIPLSPRLLQHDSSFAFGYICAGGQDWEQFITIYGWKKLISNKALGEIVLYLNHPTTKQFVELEWGILASMTYHVLENHLPAKTKKPYDLPEAQLTASATNLESVGRRSKISRVPYQCPYYLAPK